MPKAVSIKRVREGYYRLEFDWDLIISADNFSHNVGPQTSSIELTVNEICDAIDEQDVEGIYEQMQEKADEDAREAVSATADLESFDDEVLELLNPLEDEVCEDELGEDEDGEGLEVDF